MISFPALLLCSERTDDVSLTALRWAGVFLGRASRNWGRRARFACRAVEILDPAPSVMVTRGGGASELREKQSGKNE